MEEEKEILIDKVGKISCGKCCFNCKHSSNDICKLFEITTFPGGICDRYEENSAKVKRKTNEAELCNKNWTTSNYVNEKKIPTIEIPFNELIQYLPKTTVTRIDGKLQEYGQNIQSATIIRERDSYWPNWHMDNYIVLNGEKKRLGKIIGDYGADEGRVRRAITEWLYKMVKKEI